MTILGPTGPTGDPTDDLAPHQVMVSDRWPLLLPRHRVRDDWPTWEKERLAAMHDVIVPGDSLIDVGAEEGDFPALFATWGADVTLIEPNPYVWPSIRTIFEMNDLPVPEWHVALAGESEVEAADDDTDSAPGADGWPACAHWPLFPGHGFRHLWEHGGKNTRVTTLDRIVWSGAPKRVDVLTLDVEGGERFVLAGASRTLTELPVKAVFVSIHPEFMENLYGITDGVRSVTDLMASYGYTGELLAIDHEEHWLYRP